MMQRRGRRRRRWRQHPSSVRGAVMIVVAAAVFGGITAAVCRPADIEVCFTVRSALRPARGLEAVYENFTKDDWSILDAEHSRSIRKATPA